MESGAVMTHAELPQDVLLAVREGRKIEAIKLLREATGLGLANAKVLVDRAARQYADQNPQDTMSETESGLPRLLKSLFLAILLFAVYRYFNGI